METAKRQPGNIRRNQIKEAVKDILFYEGLQKLTTKNIARKVGISEGTVFKHYVSKKAIINDILDDVHSELVKPLAAIASAKEDASIRLEKYVCFHLDYLAQNKGITILLFTEASYQNDTALKEMLDKTYKMLENSFGDIIRDGIKEKIWDEKVSVENLASLYMGIPLGMNIELLLHNKNMKELGYCRNMLQLIERILRKQTE
ncbi:TetR/AcrR family transcriptional regulator [Candidatus Sulfidibacterium hydrothermale]|uniref:TetR/AcrR family transcriptional regulator n=1 Tax=Candidatus Sulfidibacterium hydrothermale TaxID=2875962 RepID=UPI001F0A76A1|nr:TetR/AcrR family transcriptional regulator [Candidatus Sulfidibacterium hydrothermale]UBM62400.1 TetR/AcrR family transcriptional regulator [Candidatus Sulfidibacterium hydrothermale]